MKIQFLSDLHLEAHTFTLKPHHQADVIVLAGDITTTKSYPRFEQVLHDTAGKPTIYIPGNHEYYGINQSIFDAEISPILEDYPNVVRLDMREHWDFMGVRFVGDTLWSDFNLPFHHDAIFRDNRELAMKFAKLGIADFTSIQGFTPVDAARKHADARHLIASERNRSRLPMVVVTHFLPSILSIDKRFETSALNPYFASDCENLMGNPVRAWIHGHTHSSHDYEVRGTRVVCNPRGYTAKENPEFRSQRMIEIDAA